MPKPIAHLYQDGDGVLLYCEWRFDLGDVKAFSEIVDKVGVIPIPSQPEPLIVDADRSRLEVAGLRSQLAEAVARAEAAERVLAAERAEWADLIAESEARPAPVVQDAEPTNSHPKPADEIPATGGPTEALRRLAKEQPDLGWLSAASIADFLAPRWEGSAANLRNALRRCVSEGTWSKKSKAGSKRGVMYRPGAGRSR